MTSVAFQGVSGAYSHLALKHYFRDNQVEILPQNLSEDVFKAVVEDRARFGFVPVENSIVGNVSVNMDLFYEYDVSIIGEFFLPINHCLLASAGANIDDIKQVHSHPIALAQCQKFLSDHNMRGLNDYDTAGSAKSISLLKDSSKAAIASELCAEYYNLKILAKNIQSTKTNITRFVCFSSEKNKRSQSKEKMSLYIRTDHKPGALLKAITLFSIYQINLTRLQSRPVPENPFTYGFYIDLLCPKDFSLVEQALEELRAQNPVVKVLGLYKPGKS